MAYDVRALANFVLDLACERGRAVSNLSINKIAYFLHVNYLVAFERPLTTAKIEAWKYGPVFRELYSAFKAYDDGPIVGRARRINPATGETEICRAAFTPEDRRFLEDVASKYIDIDVGSLVYLSHQPGGPWDQVWNHDTLTNATMRISDDLIKAYYRKASRH